MSSNEINETRGSFGPRFDPAAVTVVGPYHGVRYFAAGGMAWVYEARHPQFAEKRLAVKLMKPEFAAMPMMRDRFLREAQLLARIGHPHLVSVHSFGMDEASHCPYFAMDYIDGGNLAEKLEADGPLSVEAAGELYDRVLGALAALHQQGVIHRDIKPLNIFLWRSGEPMLADLGIARDTAAGGAATTQHYIGSPKYSSPEQANGLRIDVRSDIFSLGLSLFETLVGYHPYEDAKNVDTSSAASLIGLLAVLYRDKKPIPLEFPRDIPRALRAVIRRACEIQPDKRFADADEMRRALRNAVRSADSGGDSTIAVQIAGASSWVQENGRRLALGIGGAVALAALVGAGYLGWGSLQRGNAQTILARARQAVAAIAPDDPVVANRVRAANEAIERDRPETAIGLLDAVCDDLAKRTGASLEKAVQGSAGTLQRTEFAVRHAGVGGAAWDQLAALAHDESKRAPRAGTEPACDAPLRLVEYSSALRDASRELDAALETPDLKARVSAARDAAHQTTLAPSIDSALLAEADRKFASVELPEALELYARAELGARAAELSQHYSAGLRDLAAAPEFAERRSQVSSALARIVKLGSLSDFDELAAELDPAAKDAAAAVDAVRGDVATAIAAADQALAHAREAGVSKDGLARGAAQLASAREDLGAERFAAALGSARGAAEELDGRSKRMTEGSASAQDALQAARAKRETAVAAGAGDRTLAKGDALMAKAQKLVEDGNPADAADVFASAETEFGSARNAAIATATKLATVVRDRAAAEKKRAGELGATAADLSNGDAAEQKGEEALAKGDFNGAQFVFGAARDAYRRAPLRVAGERAAQAREAAVSAGAAEDALASGDEALRGAPEAAQPEDALQLYATAEAAFTRARDGAIAAAEKAKARVLQTKSDAQAARVKAQDAGVAEAEFADGDREAGLGDGALEKGDVVSAQEHFASARTAYQRAPLRGAEERATRAREEAVAAGANPAALAKGDTALRKAGEAKGVADALRSYAAAESSFARARTDAVAVAEKAKAQEALEQVRGERQLAAKALAGAVRAQATQADLGPGRAALDEGDAALAKGDAGTASERFQTARALFEEAAKAAAAR